MLFLNAMPLQTTYIFSFLKRYSYLIFIKSTIIIRNNPSRSMIFWRFAGISKVFHLSCSLKHEMPLAMHGQCDLNFPSVTTPSQAVSHLIQQILDFHMDVLISYIVHAIVSILVLSMLT